MRTISGVVAAGLLSLGVLASSVAAAHHSFAVFFDNEAGIVSVRGVVTQFNFTNPHGLIRMQVKEKSGETVEWKAETNSPSILERRGWKKDSLKAGDEIIMEGWRARDGARYMRMRKVTKADGTPVGIPFESMEVR
ncbi:MAG TPA: DUF6152 family protein [Steroidobacteraceae bacterium]|nr:DUF6152 family protein [Steroidobacteraceae bacterium]